jgi:hypothetical protein
MANPWLQPSTVKMQRMTYHCPDMVDVGVWVGHLHTLTLFHEG